MNSNPPITAKKRKGVKLKNTFSVTIWHNGLLKTGNLHKGTLNQYPAIQKYILKEKYST